MTAGSRPTIGDQPVTPSSTLAAVILSDRDLAQLLDQGRLVVKPLDRDAIQPSSIDLRVGHEFLVFASHRYPYIDVRQRMDGLTELVEASVDEPFILHPGEFVLASTLEQVTLPDDHVGRLEGKSSLGRLGLLIHSSLPGSEPVLMLEDGQLRPRPIGEVVAKQLEGRVAAFVPDTFEIAYHEITGWYEGPADRIFEVVLASGRRVRVTAGHNLFTLDRDGRLAKIRTGELQSGTRVAIPRYLPDPPGANARLHLLKLAPESAHPDLILEGPSVTAAFDHRGSDVLALLRDAGISNGHFWRGRARLPLPIALQVPGFITGLGPLDRVSVRGSARSLPVVIEVDADLAWLIGLYVAEGYQRRKQAVWSNTDQAVLDRAQRVLARLGLPVYRSAGAVTCCSVLLSNLLDWLGTGPCAYEKRVPPAVFGWPASLVQSFLEGFVDGDGSRETRRVSLWSSSEQLVSDLLLVSARLGRRATASFRSRAGHPLYQVSLPHREHKLLTAVPLPDRLLVEVRTQAGLRQATASRRAGYRNASGVSKLENRWRRDAVWLGTLRRLRSFYESCQPHSPALHRLTRLVDGGLLWDEVVDVRDTGSVEPVYDLEVRPGGRRIENFLAGYGGVFVSNTAGFVDPGFSGHLTLELSNVANLPITIYPGMKIGQLCLFRMTSPADRAYGSSELGSKYQGQRGPTASRYFENFHLNGD